MGLSFTAEIRNDEDSAMVDDNSITWANKSVFLSDFDWFLAYAPRENDGVLEHRILQSNYWIPHLTRLDCNVVSTFSPVFERRTGTVTTSRDYQKPSVTRLERMKTLPPKLAS